MIPVKTVERFSIYRQILFRWQTKGKERFYSHELAEEAGITSAQVRRDLMSLETIGTPTKGYVTVNIIEELGHIIEGESGQNIVLVGVGNLGRAILSYFVDRRPDLKIIAAFDVDPAKVGRSFAKCICLPIADLAKTVRENNVIMAILTVPEDVAQETATMLVDAGIAGMINFTPVKVKVPKDVFVEEVDISTSLEKTAYFARMYDNQKKAQSFPIFAADQKKKVKFGHDAKTILCIEDDHDIVASYRAILQKAGYRVEAAFDGDSGLAMARELSPDLIILDVMMSTPTEGFDVAHALRHDDELKSVAILMVTSIAGESNIRSSEQWNDALQTIDAFIEKPVAPNSLLASVKKLLSPTADGGN